MSHRILLANVTLAGRSGTEIVTRDLAVGLARRGHAVTVYSPALGPIADAIRSTGVDVVSRLDEIRTPPAIDIVHGHHYIQTMDAIAAFPAARGVFVCHDRTAAHSIPPLHPRVIRFVAVDRNCLERLQEDWKIPAALTRVISNAVDLERFQPRGPLPPTPARALVFSHYAEPGPYIDVLREACRSRNIELDVMGAAFGIQSTEPERVLGGYDIVFAKARCALEAMAVGAAVVLCAPMELGSMVTSAEAGPLSEWNFGSRTLREPLTLTALLRQLSRYDPHDAGRVAHLVRERASLDSAITAYEAVYAEALAASLPDAAVSSPSHASIEPLLARLQTLEGVAVQIRSGEHMPALADDELPALTVTIDQAPDRMQPGATAFVRATLHNHLERRAVGSSPPFPVQWSYRWRWESSQEFLSIEGLRTPIRPSVASGTSGRAAIKVIAPDLAGRYVLRLTLVQESLRWLDQPPGAVQAEVPVDVRFPNQPAIT